ncbi:MAG: hypothetical protein V1839_03995 [archaeon]
MIPKVEFVYSFIYDKMIIEKFYEKEYNFNKSSRGVDGFIESVEPKWRKVEKKTLAELAKISGLKWGEPKIKCYVTTRHFFCPFSDPLTIGVFYLKNGKLHRGNEVNFIHTLTHELIHQLFIQQGWDNKFSKAFLKIMNKHKKEIWNTQMHILLHAMHKHILLKYYGKETLRKEIESTKHYKMAGYYEAWQIVEKEGYQNILSEFRKYLKTT